MGKEGLRKRGVWQDVSGAKATIAEQNFLDVFEHLFIGTSYKVRKKPQDFQSVYNKVNLDEQVLREIYTPPIPIVRHGVCPDYAIENTITMKTLYVEVKRQDGWVEGKPRSAGRGNAHERSCKFFTPGLQKILREKGGIAPPALPFWTVFQGDIARDPCRVREITCWYGEYAAHFFMWRDSTSPIPLVTHFNKHLKHLLE